MRNDILNLYTNLKFRETLKKYLEGKMSYTNSNGLVTCQTIRLD